MAMKDSIHADVGKKISEATKQYATAQNVQQRRDTFSALGSSQNSRYLAAFKTCATMHLNTTGNFSPQYMTESSKKNYLACVQTFMDARGIKGSGANGEIEPEQFGNELSPKEMMKFFRSNYLEENKKRQDDAKKELNAAFEEVCPPNDTTAPEESKNEIKNIINAPVWVSDEEFVKLPDNERAAYLESVDSLEQGRLLKLLESKQKLDESLIAKAGIKKHDPDPNTHPDEKDDFKIESGDIIEYLMKDVILSGTAWILNQPAGFVGAASYEFVHYGARNLAEWKNSLFQSDHGILQGAKNVVKKVFGKQPATATFDPKEFILDSFDSIESSVHPLHELVNYHKKMTAEEIENLGRLRRNFAKHYSVITEDGDIIHWNGKEYEKLTPPQQASQRVNLLRNEQNILTNLTRNYFIESAGDKEKAAKDFDEYIKKLDEAAIPGSKDCPSAPEEFLDQFGDASKKAVKAYEFEERKKVLVAEENIFCSYYGGYLASEFFKQNKDSENCSTLSSNENFRNFLVESIEIASEKFWSIQQQRTEGKTCPNGDPLPSNEELIRLAKEQFEASSKNIREDKTTPVVDNIATKMNPPTEKEKETIDELAKGSISREALYNIDLANAERKLAEVGSSRDTTSLRKQIDHIKGLQPTSSIEKGQKMILSTNLNKGGER